MERRLTAILAADMVGYSRLMAADEVGTITRQKTHRRELIDPKFAEHRGRIVKTTGDGILVEFPSVVAAVVCAADIQNGMEEREAGVPEDRRIRYRIGINLGDIVIDGDDILGDGVNVAARLEGMADPGGICVSTAVKDQVSGRTDLDFQDIGERELKNLGRPIRVWRWAADGLPATADTAAPLVLPEKPSIAVLPFANMSGDPEQEFFADGMAEDIITALSRMPWFFVISRNSTFTYKGRAVDVKQVARELGVKYVLEGSVRKAGNRVRITAQLIDATTGQHVWAERYDREITDIFEVQDEVTQAIVGAVAPEFLSVEARSARRKDAAQLDAWECVMRGRALMWKMRPEDAAEARKLFERAIELAPGGEFGMSDLALVHCLEFFYRWGNSPEKSHEDMLRTVEKAVAANDHDLWALTIMGFAYAFARRWSDAMTPVDRAIEQSPNFAPAIGVRGLILALLGDTDEAIQCYDRAHRLSPRDSALALWDMGRVWAYFIEGRYEEAAAQAQKAIRVAPQNPTYRRQLASCYALLGRMDDARGALRDYLRLEPDHTIADVSKIPASNPEHLERFLEGLRMAGLPE